MSPSSGTLKSHLTRTVLPVDDDGEEKEKTCVNITNFFQRENLFLLFKVFDHQHPKNNHLLPPTKKGEDFVLFFGLLLTPHHEKKKLGRRRKNDLNAREVRFYPFLRPFYASSRAKTTHIDENPNGELSIPRVFARVRFDGDWREERSDFWNSGYDLFFPFPPLALL